MRKKVLSLLLAAGLILTSSTLPGGLQKVEASGFEGNLVAQYQFDGDFKDSLSESTGVGEGSSQPSIISDGERGQVMKSGSGNGRVKTDNPLYGKELDAGFTVSAWVDANAVDTWLGIWSFSSGTGNNDGYFGMASNGSLYFNDNPASATYQDMQEFGGTITKDGGWEQITVVMDQSVIRMYKDGLLVKELTPSTLGPNAGEGTPYMLEYVQSVPYIYFGTAGPHYWNSGDFQMDDFSVYNKALTSDEVLEVYLADETEAKNIIAKDIAALSVASEVMNDIVLPERGSSGYTVIKWYSDTETVISAEGKVTRPKEQDAKVKLTAEVSIGTVTVTQEFTVTVPKADPNTDLALYAEALTLEAGYVASDLTLPDKSGEAEVVWSSDKEEVISDNGTVTRGTTNEEVTLKATLSLAGAEDVEKEFRLIVLAQGAGIVSYVSNADNMSTDGLKGQKGGMKLAEETESGYSALHNNQPVMYTAKGAKAYVSPQIFRKADGTFGMIAADGGSNGTVILYDSEDLITYTNERTVALNGISSISRLHCVYDMTAEEYILYVENAAGSCFRVVSEDLTNFTAPEQAEFHFSEAENAPEDAVWASETPLTQAEFDQVTEKFTNPYNTVLEYTYEEEITVEQNATLEEVEKALEASVSEVKAEYSNGEEKTYSIRWDATDLENISTDKSGREFKVKGIIGGSAYYTEADDPLIAERADPCITYDEERKVYYFTASYPVNGKDGADGYDRLVIREASTIEGLADAEEYVIWDESETEGFGQFIWAPELHKIGGSWYFLSTAAQTESGYSFNLRPFLMKCNDAEHITDPESWGEPQRFSLKAGDTSALNAMSLDMTYFEAGGVHYLSWADFTANADNPNGVSSIYIATIDPSNPAQLTSNCAVISVPEYSWEVVRYVVNEGPNVIQKDGKVYLTFSASGTGAEYCIGLLTAEASDDLTDPDNWVKTPYPILTSGDFNDELCGPGHNSFSVDEYGNPLIVYHARSTAEHSGHSGDPLYDACRNAYVKPVLFDAEGVPVLNLSDEEFAMGGSEIYVTVKISGDSQETVPVLAYNFDEEYQEGKAADSAGDNDAVLGGGASYVQDDAYGQVLYLDGDTSIGGNNSFLSFPEGFFDGMDKLTISMDVKEVSRWGNYFTFAIGQDNQKYLFLKTAPENLKLAITTNTWSGEKVASKEGAYPNNSRTWINIKMVVTANSIRLYRDGELVAENANTGISMTDLGQDLKAYLGKSFYAEDMYFRGYFDNVKVYDYAMTDKEVKAAYQQEETARLAMLEDVQRVAETFEIPNMDNIKGNITLPDEKDGVKISWTSSDESVISTEKTENAGYDDTPAGVVVRGNVDQNVTLTATFSKENAEPVTKTYELTVKAKAGEITEDDYVGYLFVHFVGSESALSHEQTYFSISDDGLNWRELNDGKAVLTSNIGESGLRDHYIARSPEGDKYYMIATDLSIYNNGGNWPGAGGSGSHGIVVWESDDLVNWSEPWIAEIAPENAGCTWAPEFIYDEITGEYVVYWASTTIELDADGELDQVYENHTIYYAKTRDFRTFTEAQVYHAGGTDANGNPVKVIDSTMIEADGTYYRYTKNESKGIIVIDQADSVLGNFTEIESQDLSVNLMNDQGAVEGPIIFKMNEKTEDGEDQWCLMVDRFARGQGYYPLITTDLSSGEFTLLSEDEFSMPKGNSKYRHGYVMPLTASEYDAVQRAYGDSDNFTAYQLEKAIRQAEAIDRQTLTEESAAALETAIAEAEDALGKVTSFADVDAAVQALQTVIDGLEYKEEIVLQSITVTAPSKTTYVPGEELDLAGFSVYAVYSNGVNKDVTDAVILSGYDMNAESEQNVTVSYTENGVTVTGQFRIVVKAETQELGEDPTDPDQEPADPSERPGDPSNPNTSAPSKDTTSGNAGAQTGDVTGVIPTAVTCILAFACAAVVFTMKRRKRF